MLQIKYLKDCLDGYSYFGYKEGTQYTDGYDCLSDLIEEYPEYTGCKLE